MAWMVDGGGLGVEYCGIWIVRLDKKQEESVKRLKLGTLDLPQIPSLTSTSVTSKDLKEH